MFGSDNKLAWKLRQRPSGYELHLDYNSKVYNVRPPATIAKLVQITPISLWFMVLITNYSIPGANLNQRSHHWGAPLCTVYTRSIYQFPMPRRLDPTAGRDGGTVNKWPPKDTWRFPKMRVPPPNHPFIDGFSIINPPNHPFYWVFPL